MTTQTTGTYKTKIFAPFGCAILGIARYRGMFQDVWLNNALVFFIFGYAFGFELNGPTGWCFFYCEAKVIKHA